VSPEPVSIWARNNVTMFDMAPMNAIAANRMDRRSVCLRTYR
jgi:hypothetical protein